MTNNATLLCVLMPLAGILLIAYLPWILEWAEEVDRLGFWDGKILPFLRRHVRTELIYSPDSQLYLERFILFRMGRREGRLVALYLHHFVAPDQAHLHDHPRTFVSVGLRGQYQELDAGGRLRRWKAPFFRVFPGRFFHRVCWISGSPLTLVLTFGKSSPWGFLVDGAFVGSLEYAMRYGRDMVVSPPRD